jgi:NADPH:quinone reductase-like Zn-dependent oxidoreductase
VVRRAPPRGERLLITNGAGNTGSLAIQLAAAVGVELTATASAVATDRLRGLAAAQVVDYHDPNGRIRYAEDSTVR